MICFLQFFVPFFKKSTIIEGNWRNWMQTKNIKKLVLCLGIFLSGCQSQQEPVADDYHEAQIMVPNDSTQYHIYIDISQNEKEQLENWISNQKIQKEIPCTYYGREEFNYELSSHDMTVWIYTNSFDEIKINNHSIKQYQTGKRYLFQILFSSKMPLSQNEIETVIAEITSSMSDCLFFEDTESFYNYLNNGKTLFGVAKVLKK